MMALRKSCVNFAELQLQVLKPAFFNGQILRSYSEQKGDEDISWQWAVRKSPCQSCHEQQRRRSWISRLIGNKDDYELTNRHKVIKHTPKLWELEYYTYLLPDSFLEKKPQTETCGSSQNVDCRGKWYPIRDNQAGCQGKLTSKNKEPFSLNKVCGKDRVCRKRKDDSDDEFYCLNDFLIKKPKPVDEGDKKEEETTCPSSCKPSVDSEKNN